MTNPLHWRQKTLGEMMTDLKARLGFVTQGAGSKLVDPILKSFLQEGQDYVFDQLDAPLSVKRTEIKLVPGSKLYDFHNDVEDEDIDRTLSSRLMSMRLIRALFIWLKVSVKLIVVRPSWIDPARAATTR